MILSETLIRPLAMVSRADRSVPLSSTLCPDYSFSYRSIDRQPAGQEAPAYHRRRYKLLYRISAVGDPPNRSEERFVGANRSGRDQSDREQIGRSI